MTGADIVLVCNRAALMTIRNAINKQGAKIEEFVITANDFTHSIEEVKQR